MKIKLPYPPPAAEELRACPLSVLAQSFNPDSSTEYLDEDYGGLL